MTEDPLDRLEQRLSERISEMREDLREVRGEVQEIGLKVAVLDTAAIKWGAIAGTLVSLFVALLTQFITRIFFFPDGNK